MNLDIRKQNTKTYNSLAQEYNQKSVMRNDFNGHIISKFAKHIITGKNVLDIGCAVGLDMSIFAYLGYSVDGIDISKEMVKLAKQKNPNAKILIGDFMEITFDKLYDGIFAQAFIHLYPKSEVESVLKKIKSLLVLNGVAHITTSKNNESKEGWFTKDDYHGKYKRYRKFWTKNELEETLKRLNFQIVNYFEIMCPFKKKWMIFTVKNEGNIHSASYIA